MLVLSVKYCIEYNLDSMTRLKIENNEYYNHYHQILINNTKLSLVSGLLPCFTLLPILLLKNKVFYPGIEEFFSASPFILHFTSFFCKKNHINTVKDILIFEIIITVQWSRFAMQFDGNIVKECHKVELLKCTYI